MPMPMSLLSGSCRRVTLRVAMNGERSSMRAVLMLQTNVLCWKQCTYLFDDIEDGVYDRALEVVTAFVPENT